LDSSVVAGDQKAVDHANTRRWISECGDNDSWSALATIGRSYGSSSSAVRRKTVSRFCDLDDACQGSLRAGSVADDANPITHNDTLAAQLTRLGGADFPVRDQNPIPTPIDGDHDAVSASA
jgi:hypothetical protein